MNLFLKFLDIVEVILTKVYQLLKSEKKNFYNF